jgi:PAS domain S-box-containing protein
MRGRVFSFHQAARRYKPRAGLCALSFIFVGIETMSAIVALRQLETLYNTVNHGIVFIDREGRVTSANLAAASMLGRPVFDLNEISPDDPHVYALGDDERVLPVEDYPSLAAIRTGAKIRNFVMGIYHPGLDERRWYTVDSCPIYEPGEVEPSASYSIFSDITEQRQLERELRQSRLHLALTQSIASIGSAVVDLRTGKWEWSDENYRIHGVERGSFRPSVESLQSLVHPEDWASLSVNLLSERDGITSSRDYRIRRPDGAERILRRSTLPLTNERGEVTGLVASVQDLTELRLAQRENISLQSRLPEATRQ